LFSFAKLGSLRVLCVKVFAFAFAFAVAVGSAPAQICARIA
jgi:hypothetical protein